MGKCLGNLISVRPSPQYNVLPRWKGLVVMLMWQVPVALGKVVVQRLQSVFHSDILFPASALFDATWHVHSVHSKHFSGNPTLSKVFTF